MSGLVRLYVHDFYYSVFVIGLCTPTGFDWWFWDKFGRSFQVFHYLCYWDKSERAMSSF
ncbi:hypothetical protein BYT27DRAFT_7189225 [Phlegmacium glaucopus]|nr:hypothetical protein BYT27DRAFT_7189225 [Phlegmacium glaucopus]